MKSAARRLVLRARVAAADEPVPSPCVNVCTMDPATGWCGGCFRTIEEIADWSGMDSPARREVWDSVATRARTVLNADEEERSP